MTLPMTKLRAVALAAVLAGLGGGVAHAATPEAAPASAPPAPDLTIAPDSAEAVDPERLAAAKKLFTLMHMDKTMAGLMNQMFKTPPGVAAGSDPATRARLDRFMSSVSVGFQASLPEIFEGFEKVYARTFTLRELQDSIDFYSSPSGQSMLTKLPQVMSQALPMVYTLTPKIYERAEADFCSHTECTSADRRMFERMRGAPPHP